MTGATAIFTGFDSAWTATNQGAIAHARLIDGVLTLVPPVVAGFERFSGFERALDLITEQGKDADLHVIGIDQPLIVPNETGRRPVEKAFYPLIGALKGGMQPANRGKAAMFGDPAPIWRFLRELNAEIDWRKSVGAEQGRFAIEVYPAPALAGLFPVFCDRRRLPKYNPANRRKFSLEDWQCLCKLIGEYGEALGLAGVHRWCTESAEIQKPTKSDQDKLDSIICVIVTYLWWRFGRERSLVVGDLNSGYIVTPSNQFTSERILIAANLHQVPVDAVLMAPSAPVI